MKALELDDKLFIFKNFGRSSYEGSFTVVKISCIKQCAPNIPLVFISLL